ncbi:hypothetical protein D3C71_1984890 [compost metagenome]
MVSTLMAGPPREKLAQSVAVGCARCVQQSAWKLLTVDPRCIGSPVCGSVTVIEANGFSSVSPQAFAVARGIVRQPSATSCR